MPYEHYNELVDAIHQACDGYELPDVLAAFVTATVDHIHHVEHEAVRAEMEAAFIKSLQYVSAVENQFHGEPWSSENGDDFDAPFAELLRKVNYRLFVGDENPALTYVDHRAIEYRQIGAARALLGWSQQQLADRAHVTAETVVRVESNDADETTSEVAAALHKALTEAGVEFLPGVTGTKGPGVRLRWPLAGKRRPG